MYLSINYVYKILAFTLVKPKLSDHPHNPPPVDISTTYPPSLKNS